MILTCSNHEPHDEHGNCPGVPPHEVRATPEQWLGFLRALPDERAVERVASVLDDLEVAHRCFIENHKDFRALLTTSPMLAQFSMTLDATYGPDVSEETVLRRRVNKIVEETGEVHEALGGMVGENPRKGFTHTQADVEQELLDVAVAALGAVMHLRGGFDVHRTLHQHISGVWERAQQWGEQEEPADG